MPDLLERLRAALADRYAVESEIGRGGMAAVYVAKDLKHGRRVAIKVLHPELAASVGGERFLREIEIAARLEHAHILALHDSGEAGGLYYYVMPYVDGESLRERLEREKQLPIEEAIRIVREVADGLGHAHRQGVVHRDIKPANVLLADGHALIADFGVARAVGAEVQGLTSTGLAVGTPAYMSPEQASSPGEVDARSDLYALGCMLYEMLAGEPPLTGPTPQATATLRLTETATALPLLRETVPGGLDAVVRKALAKSPADRFGTAEELSDALAAPEVWEEARPKRRIRRRVLEGIISIALVGAGIYLAQLFVGGGSAVDLVESRIAVLPFVPAVAGDTALENLGHEVAARITADLLGIGDIETVPYQTIRANTAAAAGSLEDAARWARSEEGAGRVAHGSMVRTGDEVSFEVNLLSSDDLGVAAQVSYSSTVSDPRLLADSISWRLLGQLWAAGEAPVVYHDHLIGRPFPAVRDFLLGERYYTETWEVAKATRAMERAFRADTTLWAASITYDYLQHDYEGSSGMPEPDPAIRAAHRQHLDRVPTPYREWYEAQQVPGDEHLRIYEEILAAHPTFWLALVDYGQDLAFAGFYYGYSAEDVIQAQAACVDAFPANTGCWVKLYVLSIGKNAAVFRRTYEHFLGGGTDPAGWFSDEGLQFVRLFMAYEEGRPPAALLDSVTRNLDWLGIPNGPWFIWEAGRPQIFHDLHRRRRELGIEAEIPIHHLYWEAYAWAMRGAWDSATAALEDYLRESNEDQAPHLAFRLISVGEFLGGLPAGVSDPYLQRAKAFVAGDGDREQQSTDLAMLLSMRGILAASRGDSVSLRQATEELRTVEDEIAVSARRALAAYQLRLRGGDRAAADSLYALTWRPPRNLTSFNRLNASRWYLADEDTTAAAKLLETCQWSNPFGPWFFEHLLLVGHCYLELARIEEARGRHGLARDYYWQFLKRYDAPVEALRPLVEEARAAYVRVGGEPARPPSL